MLLRNRIPGHFPLLKRVQVKSSSVFRKPGRDNLQHSMPGSLEKPGLQVSMCPRKGLLKGKKSWQKLTVDSMRIPEKEVYTWTKTGRNQKRKKEFC